MADCFIHIKLDSYIFGLNSFNLKISDLFTFDLLTVCNLNFFFHWTPTHYAVSPDIKICIHDCIFDIINYHIIRISSFIQVLRKLGFYGCFNWFLTDDLSKSLTLSLYCGESFCTTSPWQQKIVVREKSQQSNGCCGLDWTPLIKKVGNGNGNVWQEKPGGDFYISKMFAHTENRERIRWSYYNHWSPAGGNSLCCQRTWAPATVTAMAWAG